MAIDVVSVSMVNQYLREVLESDLRLQGLWIEGEVSNFIRSQPGHCYFSLKDAKSQIRCVWFRGSIRTGTTLPKEGDRVLVNGRVTVYETRGEYQVNVSALRPSGTGQLALQLAALKERLEHEGLFEIERKRELPWLPKTIGVVTSPTGAVFHDIVNVARRRFPGVTLVLAPTLVQGEGSVGGIVRAIEYLNAYVGPDVIIVARGGGSAEDLWSFNDEAVARAIFASRAPVVSAVGHETDTTIADFVADRRAPTPSVAAEIVLPDSQTLIATLEDARSRLDRLIAGHISRAHGDILEIARRMERLSPRQVIAERRQTIDELSDRMLAATRRSITTAHLALSGPIGQLEALNPLAILGRGYSITRSDRDGAIVRRSNQVAAGDRLSIQLAEGVIPAVVSLDQTRADD